MEVGICVVCEFGSRVVGVEWFTTLTEALLGGIVFGFVPYAMYKAPHIESMIDEAFDVFVGGRNDIVN